jgi:hypothetical protein
MLFHYYTVLPTAHFRSPGRGEAMRLTGLGVAPIIRGRVPIKRGHFPIKRGRVPIKHGHFPIKRGQHTLLQALSVKVYSADMFGRTDLIGQARVYHSKFV